MKSLADISYKQLCAGKILTVVCVLSVLFSALSIVVMINFAVNSANIYPKSIRDMYGDGDILVGTIKGYISKNDINDIRNNEKVSEVAEAHWKFYDIGNNSVYCVGVDNTELLKSRYGYRQDIDQNSVVINDVLSKQLSRKKGDAIAFRKKRFRITEVLPTKGIDINSVAIALFNKKEFDKITGDGEATNGIYIKTRKRDYAQDVGKEIRKLKSSYSVSVVSDDSGYRKTVKSLLLMVAVISLFVLAVSVLFVVGVFRSFLRKYNHDMAIIRAMGGIYTQIKGILNRQVNFILTASITAGFFLSLLFYKSGLRRLSGITGNDAHYVQEFYWVYSIAAVIMIYVAMRCFIARTVAKASGLMPIDILRGTGVTSPCYKHKSERKKRRIQRKTTNDFSLALKLIRPKITENRIVVLTVSMVVALLLSGGALFKTLGSNGLAYIEQMYVSDVVVTADSEKNKLSYDDIDNIVRQLNKTKGVAAGYVLISRIGKDDKGNDIAFQIADLKQLYRQKLINKKPADNTAVVDKKFAKKRKLKVGSHLHLSYSKIGIDAEDDFIVGDIFDGTRRYWSEVLIDAGNKSFAELGRETELEEIYVSGDEDRINKTLLALRNSYPSIKWSTLKQQKEQQEEMGRKRYGLFLLTLLGLGIVLSLGWMNTVNNMLEERRKDYDMLHIVGALPVRILKIVFLQLLIYICTGLIVGYGIAALVGLIVQIPLPSFSMLAAVGGYMLLLTLSFTGKIYKIAYNKNMLLSTSGGLE